MELLYPGVLVEPSSNLSYRRSFNAGNDIDMPKKITYTFGLRSFFDKYLENLSVPH